MADIFFAKRLQEIIEYYVKTFSLDYLHVLNLVNDVLNLVNNEIKEIKK